LNNAINRDHYPTQMIEDIFTRMPNTTIFSVLDASSGFWQIKLHEHSAKLCIFNTPFVIADDILVWGENEQQHDARLSQVL